MKINISKFNYAIKGGKKQTVYRSDTGVSFLTPKEAAVHYVYRQIRKSGIQLIDNESKLRISFGGTFIDIPVDESLGQDGVREGLISFCEDLVNRKEIVLEIVEVAMGTPIPHTYCSTSDISVISNNGIGIEWLSCKKCRALSSRKAFNKLRSFKIRGFLTIGLIALVILLSLLLRSYSFMFFLTIIIFNPLGIPNLRKDLCSYLYQSKDDTKLEEGKIKEACRERYF